jgi:hypothetical protein
MIILAGASLAYIVYSINYYIYIIYYTSDDNINVLQASTCAKVSVCAAILSAMIAIFIKKLYRKSVINDSILVRMTKALAGIIKKTYGSEKYGSDKDIKKCYIRKVWMDVIITIVVFILVPLCIFNLDDMVMFIGYGLIAFYIFYIYHSIKEYKYLRLFNKVNLNIDYLYHGMYEYVDREDTSEIMMKLANLSQGFKNSVAKQIEAEKLQVELITNVSHDLKTPLTMIKAYAEKVRDLSYKDKEKMENDLNVIIDETDRLNNLVNDLLAMSKLDAKVEELKIEAQKAKEVQPEKDIMKYYACWHAFDEYLAAAYHNELQYYLCLKYLVDCYLANNGYCILPEQKIEKFFKDAEYRARYDIGEFPNNKFNELVIKCFDIPARHNLKALYDYVIEDGKFDINNFVFRNKLELRKG